MNLPHATDSLGPYFPLERECVIEFPSERRYTWKEFLENRNKIANWLTKEAEIKPHDKIVTYGKNSNEWVVLAMVAPLLGVFSIPMNWHLTAPEVEYILKDSDGKVVFFDSSFFKIIEQVRPKSPNVKYWICIQGEAQADWVTPLSSILKQGSPLFTTPVDAGGSFLYTGGTSGRPKAVVRKLPTFAELAAKMNEKELIDLRKKSFSLFTALGMNAGEIQLACGPLYHSAPLAWMNMCISSGGTLIVLPKFDPYIALTAMKKYKINNSFMAPTLLKRLVDLPASQKEEFKGQLPHLRSLSVAAAPCPQSVKEAILDFLGPVLYEFYGASETNINTILKPEDIRRKPNSCGRIVDGCEMKIISSDGKECPRNVPGEIFVRSTLVFSHYHNDPEKTRNTIRPDGFTSVGDIAYVDEDNFVFVCDRKIDMIISGGVNIYPAEIEACITRIPAVLDCAVFGVPDNEMGEKVHAAILLRPNFNGKCTDEDIIQFCRNSDFAIAGYKVPKQVSFHNELPRSEDGKIRKRLMRDKYWSHLKSKI